MIKTKKLFAGLLSAGLLIAASCGSEGEPAGGGGAPVAARVTASIGAAQSRASGTVWGANDRIGISGAGYNNVPYITDGNGDFSPAGTGILFQSPEVVTFKAYYPYDEYGKEIDASTSDQKNQKDFDFLFAEGAKASASSPTLSFTGDNAFRHCMTRLVLDIKADANTGFSFTDIQNGEYTIYGIKHRGMFKTSTGEAMAEAGGVTEGATDWTISATPEDNNGVRSYSMILFPQSGANLTFKADIGGQHYEAELTPALEAGYVYRYNITVKNTGLSVSGCTIRDWNKGTEYDVETEVVIPPIGDKAMELADVGDFYFSDGTFADKNTELTEEQAEACIGIVFHKGPHDKDGSDYSNSGIGQTKCHGYVVALTDVGYLSWSYNLYETGVSTSETNWNGYANQKKLVDRGIDNYPAAKGCKEYGCGNDNRFAAPTGSSGWFLPSCGQLSYLHSNSDLLSTQMNKCCEKLQDDNIAWFKTDWYYWSSSEYDPYFSWRVDFHDGYVNPGDKSFTNNVRAVLAF